MKKEVEKIAGELRSLSFDSRFYNEDLDN